MKPLAFLDTETTGLDPWIHDLIEIAVIRVSPEGNVNRFHSLIRPENIARAQPEALAKNGWDEDPSRWDSAPPLIEVAEFLVQYLGDCRIVGHNIPFDLGFINAGIERVGIELDQRIGRRPVDTMTLAHEHLEPLGLEKMSLDCIRDFLGWSRAGAHRAEKDTEDVMRLYYLLNGAGHRRRLRIRLERRWRGFVRG